MSIKLESFSDIIKESISKAFINAIQQDLDEAEAMAIDRVKIIFYNARKDAKLAANKMALEMIHKADIGTVSLEIKI
jgi:hypothetical protein